MSAFQEAATDNQQIKHGEYAESVSEYICERTDGGCGTKDTTCAYHNPLLITEVCAM